MRHWMLLLSVCLISCAAASAAAKPDAFVPKSPETQIKELGRGVNVLGYDPFWRDESRARFKEHHFQRIREGGFQTVRVNLHAFRHMDSRNQVDADWLSKLDWVVETALKHRLNVILDLHDFQAVGENLEASQPKLLNFWRDVAARYKEQPAEVLFEILNEPSGQLTAERWNKLFVQALGIIRETNPRRNVIIGPPSYNNIHALKDLVLPEQDRHIIVTVHYYLPFQFTHQGAPWVPSMTNVAGIKWGSEKERADLKADFTMVQEWAKANSRPIFLGEFGAYDKGDLESRVAYTAAVAREAEANGWAWAYWQFDSDFVVFDMAKDDWNKPIYEALVPRK